MVKLSACYLTSAQAWPPPRARAASPQQPTHHEPPQVVEELTASTLYADPAVKAALKSLLEAPTAGAGGAKRGGGRRKRGDAA